MLLVACQLSRGVIGYEVSKRDWFLFDPSFVTTVFLLVESSVAFSPVILSLSVFAEN